MPDAPHLLIAYDGSDAAREAIEAAARLFGQRGHATVLYAWEPIAMYPVLGMAVTAIPEDAADEEAEDAEKLAEEGAQHARDMGLGAVARAERTTSAAWRTIVDAAERDRADLIVMGTRGMSGVQSVLMGSSSHHVAQHALCPVLVVPDGALGDARRALAHANGRVAG